MVNTSNTSGNAASAGASADGGDGGKGKGRAAPVTRLLRALPRGNGPTRFHSNPAQASWVCRVWSKGTVREPRVVGLEQVCFADGRVLRAFTGCPWTLGDRLVPIMAMGGGDTSTFRSQAQEIGRAQRDASKPTQRRSTTCRELVRTMMVQRLADLRVLHEEGGGYVMLPSGQKEVERVREPPPPPPKKEQRPGTDQQEEARSGESSGEGAGSSAKRKRSDRDKGQDAADFWRLMQGFTNLSGRQLPKEVRRLVDKDGRGAVLTCATSG